MTDKELKQLRGSKEVVKQDVVSALEWMSKSPKDIKTNELNTRKKEFGKMNLPTKDKVREILNEKMATNIQDISPGSVVDIIKSHHANIKYQEQVLDAISPFTAIDPKLKKQTEDLFNPIINKGSTYLNNVASSIVKDGKIHNVNALGDIFNEMQKAGNSPEVESYMKSLIKDVDLSTMSNGQMKDFLKRTFRADSSKGEEVLEYLGKLDRSFGINKEKAGAEFFDSFSNLVANEGNKLKVSGVRAGAVEKMTKNISKGVGKIIKAPVAAAIGTIPFAKSMKNVVNKRSITKMQKRSEKAIAKGVAESNSLSDLMRGKKGMLGGVLLNGAIALGEYKEGRKEGKTVLGSAGDAAFSWVKGEVLGMGGMLALGAIKGTGKLAVKGTIAAMETSRSMNNLQRFTPFADAQFQDNQQLATMRQSGMELAKMSQYNLQQTLMGTEAKYLHR